MTLLNINDYEVWFDFRLLSIIIIYWTSFIYYLLYYFCTIVCRNTW